MEEKRLPGAPDAVLCFLVTSVGMVMIPLGLAEAGVRIDFQLVGSFMILLIPLVYAAWTRLDRVETFSLRAPSLKDVGRTVLVAASLFWVMLYLNFWVLELFRALGYNITPQVRELERTIQEAHERGTLFWALLLGIMPALSEELLFRGILLSGLSRSFSPVRGALYSALFFAALHPPVPRIVLMALLGFVFGMLVVYSRSVVTAMLAHLINNILVVLVVQYAPDRAVVPLPLVFVSAAVLLLTFASFRADDLKPTK